MGMDEADSGNSSRAPSPSAAAAQLARQPLQHQQQRYKLEVYNEVLRRLRAAGQPEAAGASFSDELWAHFNRLPARYAIDVNVERAEDVLTHKQLLEQARDPSRRPVFAVRVVQAPTVEVSGNQASASNTAKADSSLKSLTRRSLSIHPPPAFGSSSNLELLALEANQSFQKDSTGAEDYSHHTARLMHEITFSTYDKPKLLSLLTSILGELGLNIQEAHAFSTNDGYSLDVFVVVGWHHEETEQLKKALQKEIHKIKAETLPASNSWSAFNNPESNKDIQSDHVEVTTDRDDVWEIDMNRLKLEHKFASGSFGDLYRGSYCSQDVAIKVLKPERLNMDTKHEFAQEVFIMRRIRHKNVVQFIGACTRPPNLLIITEFMSGGSVYNYLHKEKGAFKLPALLRVAIDVSNGMNYLHQNNIIHRDLKTANLLMDENEVVKVADFGVARVKSQSGVMTAETGTYRWMAPEVIEHKPYDHKADVYSFGILLWELLTGQVPYEHLTPLQAAVGVVQKDLRPTIPEGTPDKLAELLDRCWKRDPTERPDFSEILEALQKFKKEIDDNGNRQKEKSSRRFFKVLRRGN